MKKFITKATGVMMICSFSSCCTRADLNDEIKDDEFPVVEASSLREAQTLIHYAPEFLEELGRIDSMVTGDLPEANHSKLETTLSAWKAGDFRVTLDTSQQVFKLSMPMDYDSRFRRMPDDGPEPKRPQFGINGPKFSPQLDATMAGSGDFRSASMLAFKAKQFDDGLMAAVEHAMDQGLGSFPSRRIFLANLTKALNDSSGGEGAVPALGLLGAANKLGGHPVDLTPPAAEIATRIEEEFLNTSDQSKPIGIYTWSQDLTKIFQRDRLLQTPLEPTTSHAFARALAGDPHLLTSYQSTLRLSERLSNGFANDSLALAAQQVANGTSPALENLSLFPPVRSHETDLVEKLYKDKPVPQDFDLADEMVRRITSGQLQLEPQADSGWYDYQTFALEPLVIPDKMPEAAHLIFEDSYKQELLKLFKALLALTRESHAKQVKLSGVGMGMPPPVIELFLKPQLSQEPLATFYLRRAQSYRFVRIVLLESFGAKGLAAMNRLTQDATVSMTLDRELLVMESLFYGAYLNTVIELGMTPERQNNLGLGEAGSLALYQRWNPKQDPDVSSDLRMMVPVFYDKDRELTKVWAVIGVTTKPLRVKYDTLPSLVSVVDARGNPVDLDQVKLLNKSVEYRVPYPVMVELYVKNVLNRQEMRALCDQYKTQEAIVEHLK